MATILAVDDSPSMLRMISIITTKMGHHSITAEDGQKGLELARSKQADLILTDINMPVMDGISLVEALREQPNYSHIPILIMTSKNDPEHKMKGRIAGATGWLAKPVTPDRLEKAISKMID